MLEFLTGLWGLGSIGVAVGILVALGAFGRSVPMWAWVLVIAALSGAIFAQRDLRMSAQLGYEKDQKEWVTRALEAEQRARDLEDQWSTRFREVDDQRSKERDELLKQNEELRRKLRAGGSHGMRFNGARCPKPVSVPETAAAPSLGDGTPVELTPDARQDVLNLREAIISDQMKVLALQDLVRELTLRQPDNGKSEKSSMVSGR